MHHQTGNFHFTVLPRVILFIFPDAASFRSAMLNIPSFSMLTTAILI
jgi:hypothetical protein